MVIKNRGMVSYNMNSRRVVCKDELFKTLKKGYPFIYCTETLGVKCIGTGVFRECTAEEKSLYDSYITEFARIKSLTYELEQKDYARLIEIFNQILENTDEEYCEDNLEEKYKLLWRTINGLRENEIKELVLQHEDIVELFDRRDRALIQNKSMRLGS